MTVRGHTSVLVAGILGVLVFASVVGLALKVRIARGAPHAVIDNLNARIKAWWMMTAAIGLALLAGKGGVIALFAFASFVALRENATITSTRHGDHRALVVGFFVVLPLQYYLVWIEWYGLYSIFIPVYAFLTLPILAALSCDARDYLSRTSAIKRDRVVKDWGALIGGHGGVLDRLDSVCFSAPIFFHLVRYGWTA